MKTINEIKDEVAQRHGYKTWLNVMLKLYFGDIEAQEFEKIENEAIREIATMAIEEQKQKCLDGAMYMVDTSTGHPRWSLDSDSIINAPNVELK